jgi:integrase
MSARRRQPGEGTVFRRSRDGRWVARADLGWYDGKRDRREFTGATAGEARQRREAFLALRRDGFTVPRGRAATVAEWMAHWITNIVPARIEATTLERSYRQRVRDLIIPYLGMIRLAELAEEDIEAWHASLARRRSPKTGEYLSASTITTAHRILGRALKDAVVRGKMPRNPCSNVSPPRIRRAEVHPPGPAEVARILARCETWPSGARWVLALATGLRQGEALGLRWLDVKLDGDASVSVRQTVTRAGGEWVFKAPKSEKSYRTVALPAVAVAALREHRRRQPVRSLQGLVFTSARGTPIHAKADLDDWHALLDDIGLPHCRVHDLRHAVATALLEMGTDVRVVQEILGHSSAAVTQGTYQHVREKLHQDAADSLNEWLKGEA